MALVPRVLALFALATPTVMAAEFVCRTTVIEPTPLPNPDPGEGDRWERRLRVVLVADVSESVARGGKANWPAEVAAALGRFVKEMNEGRPSDAAPLMEDELAITVVAVGNEVSVSPPVSAREAASLIAESRKNQRLPVFSPIDAALLRAGEVGGDALLLMTDGWPCNPSDDDEPCFETPYPVMATTTASEMQTAARSFSGGAWLFGDAWGGTNEHLAGHAGDISAWTPGPGPGHGSRVREIYLRNAKSRFELIEPVRHMELRTDLWSVLNARRRIGAAPSLRRGSLTLPVTSAIEGETFTDAVLVGSEHGWACSGVLVGKGVVATARHCLPATVVAFDARAESSVRVWHVTDSEVPLDPEIDVALLRLDELPDVQPSLRRKSDDTTPPSGSLRAVGYGATDRNGDHGFGTRHVIDIPATGWGCDGARAESLGCDPEHELVLRAPNRDTCNGDSGGPLYEPYVGGLAAGGGEGARVCGWRLLGLTSRPVADARVQCGDGGVYTRVDRLEPWFSETIKQLEGV